MVVVCLPVWAGWDVVMLAVCVCRGGVFSPGDGRPLPRGVRSGGPCCGRESSLRRGAYRGRRACCARAGGGNEWRVRECVGRRRALAVASGAVFEPGRGGSCCEGSAARGSRCGTWRGGGVGGGPGHLCDESVVSRLFVPGVACRCVGGGAVAGLGISSAFGFASRLLKLLSVAGFSPCGGHRMCVERRSVQVFVSAFQLIVSSCASPCPRGLLRCTAVVLAASLPVGDRGARSGRFFGAWSVDSDKLWCKGIG